MNLCQSCENKRMEQTDFFFDELDRDPFSGEDDYDKYLKWKDFIEELCFIPKGCNDEYDPIEADERRKTFLKHGASNICIRCGNNDNVGLKSYVPRRKEQINMAKNNLISLDFYLNHYIAYLEIIIGKIIDPKTIKFLCHKDKCFWIRGFAVENCTEQNLLKKIALDPLENRSLPVTASINIKDKHFLKTMILNTELALEVRLRVLYYTLREDDHLLKDIYIASNKIEIKSDVISYIKDQCILEDLLSKEKVDIFCKIISERLASIKEDNVNSPEEPGGDKCFAQKI